MTLSPISIAPIPPWPQNLHLKTGGVYMWQELLENIWIMKIMKIYDWILSTENGIGYIKKNVK